MERKTSDVYIGAALLAALVCLLAYLFKPIIVLYLVALAGWVAVALRLWATKVLFARIIATLMFPPTLLLLFSASAIKSHVRQGTDT